MEGAGFPRFIIKNLRSSRNRDRYEGEFSRILYDCLRDALNEILGETTSATILRHIDEKQLPSEIESLAETLERIFGSGSCIIEQFILERLCSRLELDFEKFKDREFTYCIMEARDEWIAHKRRADSE
ncbi:hypothetical protein J7K07_02115, partial [Candidatus Bathyarchaeota archaeon]|nr:hypothetical protein [Candidatus Bathyarchaeota archaeon]